MTIQRSCNFVAFGGLMALVAVSTGCFATRKYVQTQAVQPLQGQIQTVDKKVDKNTNELDSRISDVDRHAEQGYSTATEKAEGADKDAQNADQHAQKADQAAQGAQQTADKGVTIASKAQSDIQNIDNYHPVKTENVLFNFGHANLTDADQQQLENLAQSAASMKHYVIEVEGFTDSVGSKEYNLRLSDERADAVVRYLTENGHIPLVKIHVLGYGEDEPVANNHTRAGRKENRRVEVRIMAPQFEGQHAEMGTNQTPATQ